MIFLNTQKTRYCYIILPCYNEEKNILKLVRKIAETLRDTSYKIIAINDGSTDLTQKKLEKLKEKYPLDILVYEKNYGLAAALKTGLFNVIPLLNKEDVVITMDADLTHPPQLLLTMLKFIEKYDLIIASRYIKGGKQIGVPFYRRLLSYGINKLIHILSPKISIKDVSSGYRCYKASLLKKMMHQYKYKLIEAKGFEVSLELLLKAIKCNAKIKEIPLIILKK